MPYTKNGIGTVIDKSVPGSHFDLSRNQIEKLDSLTNITLAILAVAGTATLSLVAPNVLQAGHKLFSDYRRLTKKEKQRKIAKTFYYLKKSGLIKMRPTVNDFKIYLTEKAAAKIKKILFKSQFVAPSSRWDGKWWQVAADIPTKEHKRDAELLRRKLKAMNFYSLQRTLWFYPFDPRKQVEAVAREYNVANFVTIMEISRLDREDEDKMKSFFKAARVLS